MLSECRCEIQILLLDGLDQVVILNIRCFTSLAGDRDAVQGQLAAVHCNMEMAGFLFIKLRYITTPPYGRKLSPRASVSATKGRKIY
jgi:hypothetical protein